MTVYPYLYIHIRVYLYHGIVNEKQSSVNVFIADSYMAVLGCTLNWLMVFSLVFSHIEKKFVTDSKYQIIRFTFLIDREKIISFLFTYLFIYLFISPHTNYIRR